MRDVDHIHLANALTTDARLWLAEKGACRSRGIAIYVWIPHISFEPPLLKHLVWIYQLEALDNFELPVKMVLDHLELWINIGNFQDILEICNFVA